MKSPFATLLFIFLLLSPRSGSADIGGDLSSMIGFTIIGASTVTKVYESDGEKYVRLLDHTLLKVQFLLLDPLVTTDVVIFAKPPSKQIVEKYGKVLPLTALAQIKVLIDDEVYDAEIVR
jgi:hypothetical protein